MRYERNERGAGPYRSRKAAIFGVCRGLAEHFGVSVTGTRLVVALLTLFFFPAPAIFYIVAAFIMKLEPVLPLETDSDQEFYNSYSTSRSMALQRLKTTYESLDRRIQRIESIVTAPSYDWDSRLGE